ncbi:MAG TPA: hypothetical protein VNN10_14800, partial [Dehalococcoidia bacterium]|nr:hypothetical protein [Dehalococcoidia bacterium]
MTRLERLRALFFRELYQDDDPTSPFVMFVEAVMAEWAALAQNLAHRKMDELWMDAHRKVKEDEKASLVAKLLASGATAQQAEEEAERASTQLADLVLGFARAGHTEPTESEADQAVGEAAVMIARDADRLSALSQAVVRSLNVSALHHDWLTARLAWEARYLLWHGRKRESRWDRYRLAGGLVEPQPQEDSVDPFGEFTTAGLSLAVSPPPWRPGSVIREPRPSVRLVLYADESDELHRQKWDQA